MSNTTITPKEFLFQGAFSAAKFFLAYKECARDVQSIVDEMIEIVGDDSLDWEDRTHAVDVIIEALFPSLMIDMVKVDEMMNASQEAISANEELDREETSFAENLQAMMDKQGLTQQELAKLTDLSQPAISNILNRKCRPQQKTIVRFARALRVSPEELWPAH